MITLDLGSGLGVTLPSTLLFILLFTSELEGIPKYNNYVLAMKLQQQKTKIKRWSKVYITYRLSY